MPGLKIVVGHPEPALPDSPAPESPAPEIHRRRIPVYSAPGIDASFDVPDDYPSFRFAGDGFFLFVEGLVYDRSDEDLARLGADLAGLVAAGRPVDERVLEFLRHADGDFVVLFVHEPSSTVVVFNDLWGRLPLYFTQTPTRFLLSREPVEILPHLPTIRFDRKTIVEWLAFEYTLNDKWLVEGVERAAPASLFIVSELGGQVRAEHRVLEVRDLAASEPIRDWQKAARRYAELFLQGYAARAEKLAQRGYRLMVDLSGGFDSRLVFAGARRLGLPVECCTDETVSGDESAVALRLAETCGWEAARVDCSGYAPDAEDWRRCVFLTGGRVSAWTMRGSFPAARARKAAVPGKVARLMGLAGEIVRHAPLPAGGYGGFPGALAGDVYNRCLGFRESCGLLGLDWGEYRRHLDATVADWPERGFPNQSRRLYLISFLGFDNAGEDRHRWHFWTVSPMWSNYVLDFVYRSIGPGMTNDAFFVELLRQVYPKVLDVPLYRKPYRLGSRFDIRRRWLEGEVRVRIRQHRWVRWLRSRLGNPEKWAPRPSVEERAWIRSHVQGAFRESAAVRATFDETVVMSWVDTQPASQRLHQLLSAVWFVAEVDRRFPGRAAGPESR